MALTAPFSKYRRNSFVLWIVLCVGFGSYCIFDGYVNDAFIEKHSDAEGNPDSTLVFNLKSPYFLFPAAVILGGYLLMINGRKIVAEENALVINGKTSIPYDSIQKIDKTHFDSKGHFTLTYKGPNGKEIDRRLSDKDYDNLGAILDHLVAKMS